MLDIVTMATIVGTVVALLVALGGLTNYVFKRLVRLHISGVAREPVEVDLDYYALEDRVNDVLFGFKISLLPFHRESVRRQALIFSIVNGSQKPISIRKIWCLTKNKESIPLTLVNELEFPIQLEAQIGELQLIYSLDEIWAISMMSQGKVHNELDALLHYTDLEVAFHSVEIELSNGHSKRRKLPKIIREIIHDYINQQPVMSRKLANTCSVTGCEQPPAYVVLLYDQYPDGGVFIEQDYTCPFLCENHMQENERGIGNKGLGERRYPRNGHTYPYTNRMHAQGFSKYMPINQISQE